MKDYLFKKRLFIQSALITRLNTIKIQKIQVGLIIMQIK